MAFSEKAIRRKNANNREFRRKRKEIRLRRPDSKAERQKKGEDQNRKRFREPRWSRKGSGTGTESAPLSNTLLPRSPVYEWLKAIPEEARSSSDQKLQESGQRAQDR